MWASILAFAAKYGVRAIKWAWEHKAQLLALGALAFDFMKTMLLG